MLLVSSITPSGAAWARESACTSLPGATVIDARGSIDALDDEHARMFGVVASGVVSPDLVSSLSSYRSAASVAWVIEQGIVRSEPLIGWVDGSVAAAVTDLRTLVSMIELAGSAALDGTVVQRMRAAVAALDAGDIEWLVACPPEESAVRAAVTEVAVATASGIRVRGIAVCPMPSKGDGWPKSVRRAARGQGEVLAQAVHPIPVDRARRGRAPSFPNAGVDVCAPTITETGDREWIWSITVPGLTACRIAVGTWTSDVAYPTTHVVLDIDGLTVRHRVDATLRRCVGREAVVSGDSIAVAFTAHDQQWPAIREEGAGHD